MTETKQKRYVGVKETLIYGIANGGQCIGYNMVRGQLPLISCNDFWRACRDSGYHDFTYGILGCLQRSSYGLDC